MPPPIPVGGASYAVTHSRRKYHRTCMRFVARCSAIAALRRWPCSLRPPGVLPPFAGDAPCVPAVRLRAYRMYLIALFSCNAGPLIGPDKHTSSINVFIRCRQSSFQSLFCWPGWTAPAGPNYVFSKASRPTHPSTWRA